MANGSQIGQADPPRDGERIGPRRYGQRRVDRSLSGSPPGQGRGQVNWYTIALCAIIRV